MKSVEFVYWLQGMFELADPQTLDAKQTDLIKRHLAMVFQHEIDSSYGNQQHQAKLSEIHDPLKLGSGSAQIGGSKDGLIFRC